MAQKDYVARGRSSPRKKSKGKSKKAQGLPITTLVVAVAIVALFVGGLFYITHNKKDALQPHGTVLPAQPGSTLPPKPEERWRYIKELERRGIDMPSTQQPGTGTGSNIIRQSDLTPEQRQLLEQIDSDRRQPVTNLQEIPFNGQPVPRSQVIINEPAQPIAPPVQRKPLITSEPKLNTQPATPVQPAQPETKPANNMQNMLVQCGSFRTADQAESVRATLAFSGIESRITAGGGWHRIVLGPYSKSTAEKMRDRAAGVGVSGCILRASGG